MTLDSCSLVFQGKTVLRSQLSRGGGGNGYTLLTAWSDQKGAGLCPQLANQDIPLS